MIVRLLIWCILGFLAYTIYQAIKQTLKKPDTPPEKTAQGEEMVQDPQCGTFVPRGDAIRATVRGEQHFFCSETCRQDYDKQA